MMRGIARPVDSIRAHSSELGMEPAKYRRGAIAAPIRYGCTDSPLGRMLIAATDKGICSIQFCPSPTKKLEQGLKQEFPYALRRRETDEELAKLAGQVIRQISGRQTHVISSIGYSSHSISATGVVVFEIDWLPARRGHIPEVAKAIRHPSAVRAVAHACAANPVAIAIPCHRVLRSNGDLGGYRWGLQRKKALLEIESSRH